jgi:hypothetical protein
MANLKPERSTKKAVGDDLYWWTAASVVAVGIASATHGKLQPMLHDTFRLPPPSSSKPYRTLPAFCKSLTFYYSERNMKLISSNCSFVLSLDPFYLSEHRNATSRILHVIGTTLVIIMLVTTYRHHIPNFLIAMSMGTMLCECLSPLSQGVVEFALVFLVVGYISYERQQRIPWKLLVVGYFFAWVGHFWFEKNRPATFIYPTYSLICDFIMWFQSIVTFQLPLTRSL